MIPAGRLNPRAVGMLMEYLRTEIWRAESERRPLETKWIEYHRAYKALPDTPMRDFPFLGAANFVVPVVATDVDIIYSRIMGILFGPENLWSTRALRPDMVLFARRLQEFLQWAQHNELNVYNSTASWILEMCKLGTGVLKQRYVREWKRVYQFRESDSGLVDEHAEILLHDHPQQDWVSIFNFLVPTMAAETLKDMPWCSERVFPTWGQVQSKVRAGIYDPQGAARLAQWKSQTFATHQTQLLRMDLLQPSFGDSFDVRETWLDFDITGVDGPEAIKASIHLPSMTILNLDYNPFFDQGKPYSCARFLRQEGRFYGIGLAEMLEPTQDEVTTLRRQRVDAYTISNAPMMKARQGIGIKEDEPIIIGRWIIVREMDDIEPVNMGRPIDTTMPHEQTALQYASRRTGVNDYIAGDFSPAMGYSTASVGVQNLKEAAKRFDQTLREVREALAESGTRLTQLYQQFNLSGKEYLAMGDADGAMVHQVLQFPMDMIRAGVGIDVTATSAAFNKEMEIRSNTIIMQMLNQYYMGVFQMMQIFLNPQMPPQMRQVAYFSITSGGILMRRILDDYGIQDNDKLVPEMEALLGGQQQIFGQAQQLGLGGQPVGGGLAGPQGMLQQPGMGAGMQGGGGAPGAMFGGAGF